MNLISQIKKKVKNKVLGQIIFEENLSKYSWFNLGGPAKVIFKPKNLNELSIFLENAKGFDKIKVFEPTPNTLILSNPFIFFKKIDNSFKFFGLNTTFAGPPKLNHEYFERFSSNII